MEPTLIRISIPVSDSIGRISALIMSPQDPKALIVLAHGAGAGMTHHFMEDLSKELVKKSMAVMRYNFPYMENKKGRPDPSAIAEKTVSAVLDEAHKLYPKLPVFASGKSFGGRMTSQKLSKECPAFVNGIIFVGFPLHPIGQPSVERAAHLKNVSIPMLFLQGTKDKLAELPLIEKTCSELVNATLVKFDGADHSFKVGKRELIPDLAEEVAGWTKL
jgi:predicted alpha/beta-hydrolase family hydrolase